MVGRRKSLPSFGCPAWTMDSLPSPVWSKNSCGLTLVVFQEPAEPFATVNGANHVIIPFTNLGSEAALRLYVPARRAVIADGEGTGELDTCQPADLYDCRGSGVGCLGGAAASMGPLSR